MLVTLELLIFLKNIYLSYFSLDYFFYARVCSIVVSFHLPPPPCLFSFFLPFFKIRLPEV